jgi:hypothetical protein
MIRAKHLGATLAALLLAGCAGVDLVEAGKPADLGDGVSVVPTTAWARIHAPGMDPILTIDGIGLGKPIFSVGGVSDKEVGAYTSGMLPNDIMDLLVGNLSKSGNQSIHASNLAPAKFGATTGFRFDVSYVTAMGLDMRGEALVAQRAGKLDVLLFVAPEEYYFGHRQPDAEQLFATVQAG